MAQSKTLIKIQVASTVGKIVFALTFLFASLGSDCKKLRDQVSNASLD